MVTNSHIPLVQALRLRMRTFAEPRIRYIPEASRHVLASGERPIALCNSSNVAAARSADGVVWLRVAEQTRAESASYYVGTEVMGRLAMMYTPSTIPERFFTHAHEATLWKFATWQGEENPLRPRDDTFALHTLSAAPEDRVLLSCAATRPLAGAALTAALHGAELYTWKSPQRSARVDAMRETVGPLLGAFSAVAGAPMMLIATLYYLSRKYDVHTMIQGSPKAPQSLRQAMDDDVAQYGRLAHLPHEVVIMHWLQQHAGWHSGLDVVRGVQQWVPELRLRGSIYRYLNYLYNIDAVARRTHQEFLKGDGFCYRHYYHAGDERGLYRRDDELVADLAACLPPNLRPVQISG